MTADYGSRLPRMLQETCVAEFSHVLLSILGFGARRSSSAERGAG